MRKLVFLLTLTGMLFAQEAGKLPSGQSDQVAPADPNATIRVEVSRVPLLFTVTDKKNRFVTDLDREDFRVFDKGEQQVIKEFVRESELPLRIGIIIDASNSVRDRFKFEQEAAIEFIRGVLREERDRAFLVSFDTRAETARAANLRAACRGRHSRSRRTAPYRRPPADAARLWPAPRDRW